MAWPDTYEPVEDWAPGKTPDADPIVVEAEDMNYLRRLLAGRPWVNAKEKGATGGGVTDDAPPIQEAIVDCGASGGGRVIFPPGDYRLASRAGLPEYGQARYGVALYGRVQGRKQSIAAGLLNKDKHGGVKLETS